MYREIVLIILLILSFCSFSFAQEKKETEQKVDGFSLVQYKDRGEKKWEMNGKSAEVEKDKIKIDEISAVAFGEGERSTVKLKAGEGSFNKGEELVHLEDNVVAKTTDGTTLMTDSLYWDTKTKNVFSDEHVNIKKADFQVNGIGAVCDLENKTAEIKEGVTANIATLSPAYLGAGGKREGTTVITCNGPLELNYKKNRASFLNDVKVEDREGDIFADRIDVYYNPTTRRIKCVVARGNVRIVNGENVTYSEKAIYLVDEGRVVLPNRPKLVIQTEAEGNFN
jgi:LPS export ABC transporter protein LptC